eukprot:CAMPEP_0185701242 /NCGR_PEP_ID=MMETSP1164-20130828/8908_1 /TAXON_ID=1104430 /ORGANISM="Chrysoreinhardia sp, Strain CCMP2950" /LENGTH=136 /DNA_ID=CAMNT_0028368263 /DNA_START=26 /DNA_END=432 /DNA_ORIENTATION=-
MKREKWGALVVWGSEQAWREFLPSLSLFRDDLAVRRKIHTAVGLLPRRGRTLRVRRALHDFAAEAGLQDDLDDRRADDDEEQERNQVLRDASSLAALRGRARRHVASLVDVRGVLVGAKALSAGRRHGGVDVGVRE